MRKIAQLRLVAQRLAGPGFQSPVEVVRWLTALQAQDYAGALTSVALRTAAGSRSGVEAALDAGEIVRSWPMRGTLHLVAAEDLSWMLRLLTPRVVAGAAARRTELGLDERLLDRTRDVATAALRGGGRLSRSELLATWESAGLATVGGRGYHMLGYLAETGTLCFGPTAGTEQLIVLISDWIPHPRRLEREEALGELALRYFRSHGPATAKDFARWANLLGADVRTGVALARPHLAVLDVDGVELLLDPHTPELLQACRNEANGTFLLPGFDEFMLGYADRSAALPAQFAARIVPGGNGVFRPTVIGDAQVIGTWKYIGRGAKRGIQAIPFESFSPDTTAAINRCYADLTAISQRPDTGSTPQP